MAKARKGKAVKKGLKFFIYGQQGTWKSSLALEMLKLKTELGRPLRVAYIDTEFGSVDSYLEDYEAEGIDTDNLLLVYTNVEEEIIEWVDNILNNEDLYIEDEDGEEELVLDAEGNKFVADAIIVDSMTVVLDTTKFGMIQVSEKRAGVKASKKDISATEKFVATATAGMELKDYDKLNHRGKNINRKLIANTDKYVVVTAREKVTYTKKKINGQIENIPTGFKPDCYKGSEYEYYTVLHMYEDEEDGLIKAQVERKDRTKRYSQGEIIENPTLLDWQEVIDRNKGKKAMPTVKSSYNENVDAETEKLIKDENKTAEFKSENVAEEEKSPETAEELLEAIKAYRNELSPTKRKSVSSTFKNADLPTKPEIKLGVEVLKKMYEAIQTI